MPKRGISLTPEEEANLLWEQGDFFEIISGNLTGSSRRQFRQVASETATLYTEQSFFFESMDPAWGTREWIMMTEDQIQNGPALLILYRRGNEANAWGVISMVNRSWTHVLPLGSISLAKGSTKGKQINTMGTTNIIVAMAAMLVVSMFTCGLPLLVAPILMIFPGPREFIRDKLGISRIDRLAQDTASTARSFLFRLTRDADQYWQGGKPGNAKL